MSCCKYINTSYTYIYHILTTTAQIRMSKGLNCRYEPNVRSLRFAAPNMDLALRISLFQFFRMKLCSTQEKVLHIHKIHHIKCPMHRFEWIHTLILGIPPSVAILQLSSMQLSSTQHHCCIYTKYIMHTQYISCTHNISCLTTNQQRCISSICSSSSCVELNEIQDNCMTATLGSYLKLNLLFIQICSLDIGIWCILCICSRDSCLELN